MLCLVNLRYSAHCIIFMIYTFIYDRAHINVYRSSGKRIVRRVTASPRGSITPGSSAPGTPKRSLSYNPNRSSGPSLSTSDLSSLITMIGGDEQGSSREASPAGGTRLRRDDSGQNSSSSSLASSRRRRFGCLATDTCIHILCISGI